MTYMNTTNLAPIVLFVYHRPKYNEQTQCSGSEGIAHFLIKHDLL